jgi:hypothetical protein
MGTSEKADKECRAISFRDFSGLLVFHSPQRLVFHSPQRRGVEGDLVILPQRLLQLECVSR